MAKQTKTLGSIGLGKIVDLEEVPDPMFSKRKLGEGYAIQLTHGRIVAPISGRIFSLFPTSHAFGILSDDIEVLVHLGIDTVALAGEGFFPHVNQGDYVNKGDLILTIDCDLITSKGYNLLSPVIVTSKQAVEIINLNTVVTQYETDVAIIE